MWNKYPDVKPDDGQKVLCLIFGSDVFPATFVKSSNGRHSGWFPEVDCISVAGDLVGRMDATNPCFEGEVDYWMEYPALPSEPVRDYYKLPPEPMTCETCKYDGGSKTCSTCDPTTTNWAPRSPQSADVETVRSKIELAIKFGLPIDARMALREALAALDRIAAKEG